MLARKKPKPPAPPRPEFFYQDENGKRQDAALHEPILEQGYDEAAAAISREVALRLGIPPERAKLIGKKPRRR